MTMWKNNETQLTDHNTNFKEFKIEIKTKLFL